MPETAGTQLNRIVQLVADLSKAEGQGAEPATLDELSARYGAKRSLLLRDLRVLTEASDDPDGTWLASLTVLQEEDRITVRSLGPYRRPIRFTPDELLVLQAALATESDLAQTMIDTLRDLSGATHHPGVPIHALPTALGGQAETVDLAVRAFQERRLLRLRYAGEGAERPRERVVEVHDVVAAIGRHYLVAWCRAARGWRHFRADRVLDAALLDVTFEPRRDAPEIRERGDLFDASEDVDEVRVRFAPSIARWIAERYPRAEPEPDGSVVVVFQAVSVDWLVRHVLHYGAEAEVLEPAAYRHAIRRAVS